MGLQAGPHRPSAGEGSLAVVDFMAFCQEVVPDPFIALHILGTLWVAMAKQRKVGGAAKTAASNSSWDVR